MFIIIYLYFKLKYHRLFHFQNSNHFIVEVSAIAFASAFAVVVVCIGLATVESSSSICKHSVAQVSFLPKSLESFKAVVAISSVAAEPSTEDFAALVFVAFTSSAMG